MTSQDKSQFK